MHNYKTTQPTVWFNRNLAKSNQNCVYCAIYIGVGSDVVSNKEHLIARNFVPSDYYDSKDFNLIFRCCVDCNNRKSNIERHISSTTLLNSDARLLDMKVNSIALNKANNDYHPDQKGKLVIDSFGKKEINISTPGLSTKVGFIYPPQSNENFVCELAFRHIQGLFALLNTKNPIEKDGTRSLNHRYFHVLGIYPKHDWGNPEIESLMKKVSDWIVPCKISVAKGYFKAKLYCSNVETAGWFWALEWNRSLRVLGAICTAEQLNETMLDLPEDQWSPWITNKDGTQTRTRRQIPLTGSDPIFGDLEC